VEVFLIAAGSREMTLCVGEINSNALSSSAHRPMVPQSLYLNNILRVICTSNEICIFPILFVICTKCIELTRNLEVL
jgi:hypothetical protein